MKLFVTFTVFWDAIVKQTKNSNVIEKFTMSLSEILVLNIPQLVNTKPALASQIPYTYLILCSLNTANKSLMIWNLIFWSQTKQLVIGFK